MGQGVSAIILSVGIKRSGGAEERRKQANNAWNALFTIVTQRTDIFYEGIRNATYDPNESSILPFLPFNSMVN